MAQDFHALLGDDAWRELEMCAVLVCRKVAPVTDDGAWSRLDRLLGASRGALRDQA
ncbi:MAG TPA: hypothetical protein VJY34_05760 [Roseiarcus sp.]|nr:hypothetical protein [Roseiarcus sp.]